MVDNPVDAYTKAVDEFVRLTNEYNRKRRRIDRQYKIGVWVIWIVFLGALFI